jgi:hypothetical protein
MKQRIPGAQVILIREYNSDHLSFYCPMYRPCGLGVKHYPTFTYDCDASCCDLNGIEIIRGVTHWTMWKCRRSTRAPPCPDKMLMRAMFAFIQGVADASKC